MFSDLIRKLRCKKGCFGGGSSSQASAPPAPPPDPPPSPIVSVSQVEGQVTEEERRRKLERLRRGLRSTIKTSSRGLTGSGADLATQTLTGKNNLGS